MNVTPTLSLVKAILAKSVGRNRSKRLYFLLSYIKYEVLTFSCLLFFKDFTTLQLS